MANNRFIIISGLSGSGKSVALATIEDLGYYCIDNLPVELLSALADQVRGENGKSSRYNNMAVGIDARNTIDNLARLPEIMRHHQGAGLDCQLFFLQAEETELLKRFSETRRKHPLTHDNCSLLDAVRLEQKLLEPISENADLVIDTTHTNQHQLRDIIRQRLQPNNHAKMSILFQSFGFKHGVPTDVDYVFDVRCLPNPHWEPRLRPLTGKDKPVVQFLEQHEEVNQMFDQIFSFMETWIPHFENNNRTYLTVAIGCTGGQHRSVYLTERLAKQFSQSREAVILRHREMA